MASPADPDRRVIFVTRKFPPSTGGMETAALGLSSALSRQRAVTLIASGRSNRWLPLVAPALLVRSVLAGWRRDTGIIVMQDGVLAPVGAIVQLLTRRPVVVILHGLEVTHDGGLLAALLRFSLPRVSRLVAVSTNTARLLGERYGLRADVVANGVDDNVRLPLDRDQLDEALAPVLGVDADTLRQSTVLLTVGRLVARKGVAWFTREVFPSLVTDSRSNYLYLVVGRGAELAGITAAAEDSGVSSAVRLLGGVGDDDLRRLYNRADVFVMPNVPVPGDVEGFGLVAIEASSCGTPVAAADIDGIPDAVHHGSTGLLIAARDSRAWVEAVPAAAALDRTAVREHTLRNFSWDRAARELGVLLDATVRGGVKPVG